METKSFLLNRQLQQWLGLHGSSESPRAAPPDQQTLIELQTSGMVRYRRW